MATTVLPTGPTIPGGSTTGTPPGATPPGAGAPNPVDDFFGKLTGADFNIIAPVSLDEAKEAITLFSVVNVLLAGKGERMVGTERKTDVLGVLTLYYGLQDRSLTSKIVVKSQTLFSQIDQRIKELRDELDSLGPDVDFLEREAKRQFNLGRNNEVAGNLQFPRLFKRYVEIANDPLLFLDLRQEQANQLSDKEKVAKAFDLLRELKDVILQLIRSLSKYGTFATQRVNIDWAAFESGAMGVLKDVALARLSDDKDEERPLAVLAALTGKSLDTQIAPYFALAREGKRVLDVALEAYQATEQRLEANDEAHLQDLFQPQGKEFLTTRMRRSAAIIRAFPLLDWN